MNTTSNGKTQTTNSTSENVFLPNISSDNNANPSGKNNLKNTGAIPKVKINTKNIPNGVKSNAHVKINNNLHDISRGLESSSTESLCDKYDLNNVDRRSKGKHYSKINNSTSSLILKNGYKNSKINGDYKDVSEGACGHVNDSEINKSKNCSDVQNCESSYKNMFSLYSEPGPSTSSNFNNIRTNFIRRIRSSDSESSSDTGNDELSCSDECCIYTYKGDVADLPQSFMNLDVPDNNEAHNHSRAGSRGSSPEMDFLEMDFDPGPSCDADSDESSAMIDLHLSDAMPVAEEIHNAGASNDIPVAISPKNETESNIRDEEHEEEAPLSSLLPVPSLPPLPSLPPSQEVDLETTETENNLSQQSPICQSTSELQNLKTSPEECEPDESTYIDTPWIPKVPSYRTKSSTSIRDSKGHHSSSGDLISPSENVPSTSMSIECRINTSSFSYHSTMEKQLVLEKQSTKTEMNSVERTMIWTEQEAAVKQITQIGTSACGATAVLNVLWALGHEIPSNETVLNCVNTKLRANSSPLVPYLLSRSSAGTTHTDIIDGLQKISNDKIYARFFHMYPERYVCLSHWLSHWIKKGAIPIATLNLQKGIRVENSMPDAWHHQMIFGVGPHGIFLTNPLERVEEGLLWPQLSSESVLMVRREDVISRWSQKSFQELIAMSFVEDEWRTRNVVGQVVNVIREHSRHLSFISRTHVAIPAAYSAGITLAMNVDNPACEALKCTPELPLLNTL